MKLVLLINLILLFCSCKNTNEKLNGVWIFDNEVNILNINEPSAYKTNKQLIFDFKENNKLIIKSFGIKNNTIHKRWNLKSDSIIELNNEEYSIKKIEKDKLTLIDYNRADTFVLTLKRARQTGIKLNINQTENILKSHIWKSKDLTLNQEYNSFEFFKNNTMVYRYKMNKEDSIEYLQNENWGISQYQNYFFLYNYSDLFYGKGNWEKINQILEISDDSLKLEKDFSNKIYHNEFHSKNPKSKNIANKIIGKWKSENSLNNDYGKYISQNQIDNGIIKLCDEELFVNITKDFIEFKTDSFTSQKYKWEIGKDNKTLVLENEYKFDNRKGSFIKIADLIQVKDSDFKLHIFENSFSTGIEKPNQLIINKIQNFKRIK